MHRFVTDYTKTITEAIGTDYSDNYDVDRFGTCKCRKLEPKTLVRRFLLKLGMVSTKSAQNTIYAGLEFIKPYLSDLEWLYKTLADEESRSWLVSLTAYRCFGYRKIKLPTNIPDFWKAKDLALQIPRGAEEIDPQFLGWKLHERSLELFGYPIRMFCGEGACYTTFVHEQYRCETVDGAIECEEGDIAVDAGGCYGDTALYLAHKSGSTGKVASFEFLPVNVSIFRRNMALNPGLASRVRLYENPVWSVSGDRLYFNGNGPGTNVGPVAKTPDAAEIKTLRIDDLVVRGDYPRIDFIKMDIEGAELEALKGSEAVLRRFRPKLAITVYHDFKDFWEIPKFLDRLGLGYRFYLRHFTIHAEETVLFAVAK
jgi:FkbM family methyltransferase